MYNPYNWIIKPLKSDEKLLKAKFVEKSQELGLARVELKMKMEEVEILEAEVNELRRRIRGLE